MAPYQVRILELLDDGDVVELDVEELVDALQRAADRDVVLELDRDFVVDEGFEEAVRRGVGQRWLRSAAGWMRGARCGRSEWWQGVRRCGGGSEGICCTRRRVGGAVGRAPRGVFEAVVAERELGMDRDGALSRGRRTHT